MVHLTKIYTKTGDGGETSLANNKRTPKHSPEIIALGAIDEANSTIGMLGSGYYNEDIQKIQSDLFDIGALLAGATTIQITDARVEYLEKLIDEYNSNLEPLHSFVLPTGPLHHARTVVRRAEIQVWWAEGYMKIDPVIMKYLNRLSDLLFVMARYHNKGSEVIWVPRNG